MGRSRPIVASVARKILLFTDRGYSAEFEMARQLHPIGERRERFFESVKAQTWRRTVVSLQGSRISHAGCIFSIHSIIFIKSIHHSSQSSQHQTRSFRSATFFKATRMFAADRYGQKCWAGPLPSKPNCQLSMEQQ